MKIRFLIVISFLTVNLFAQQVIDAAASDLLIQPQPKSVTSLNKAISLGAQNTFLSVIAEKDEERKAANYFNYLFKNQFGNFVNPEVKSALVWQVRIELKEKDDSYVNDQHYKIKCDLKKNEISISSPGQLGLLYGVVAFLNFIQNENGVVKVNLFDVDDWPEYSKRIYSTVLKPGRVDEMLNYALLNKMESVAIASRVYPWYQIDDEYQKVLNEIKNWRDRFGGPEIMQSHNIYEKKHIEISNSADITNLKNVIEAGIRSGISKIMILADDTPPFKYQEGYVLTSESDKKQFKHMAEAHTFLMNTLSDWLNSNSFHSELYYVPPFYTYEDMNYGDMGMYKDTPWANDALEFLKRDLEYVGHNMYDDVFIIWCGPFVRSRKISKDDLNNWTNNLKGKVPFLWDNTIYSHHPFTSTPLFTAYNNDFPGDFSQLTAGNGMFVNGNADSEDSKTAMITVNDYLWDPANYNPERSIKTAMERFYGIGAAHLLMEFKDTELGLRKKIGERKLWFEADTLWSIIRKIRYIHDKNPFHYHLNYTRMKALRLQLKNSVPQPLPKEEFIKECLLLDQKRKNILEKVKLIDEKIYERIKTIMMPIPDFNNIQ